MMFFVGYIGAPPTIGFSVANSAATVAAAPRATIVRFLLIILAFRFTRPAQRPDRLPGLSVALLNQVFLVIRRIAASGCSEIPACAGNTSFRWSSLSGSSDRCSYART